MPPVFGKCIRQDIASVDAIWKKFTAWDLNKSRSPHACFRFTDC